MAFFPFHALIKYEITQAESSWWNGDGSKQMKYNDIYNVSEDKNPYSQATF